MQSLTVTEFRVIVAVAAVAALGMMLLAAALEYAREAEQAEIAVTRAELAASEISRLLEEAREITRQAAPGGRA